MKKFIGRFGRTKKQAQSLIEYGLILGLVAVIAIAALQVMGGHIKDAAETAGTAVENSTENAQDAFCQSIGMDDADGDGVCE